jgi:hypothetical protein
MDQNGNFESIDDLVAYLTKDGRCEEAEARRLIEGIMAADDWGGRVVTPEFCWGTIVDFGFLDGQARAGWVTREGRMLSAAWGAHERLLDFLKIEIKDVEEAGWVRVTPHSWQCRYKLSREQTRRVEQCGQLVDPSAERLKPHWRPPIADQAPSPPR